jgi:hypothetical protein
MCDVEPGPRSSWQAFLWWETRRLGYNAFLASAALISFGGCAAIGYVAGTALSLPDLAVDAILVFVIGNVAYTGGWLIETEYRRRQPGHSSVGLPAAHANQGVRFVMELGLWSSALGVIALIALFSSAA